MKKQNSLPLFPFPNTSYQILCPKLIQGVDDPKKVAAIILEQTGLADDTFRLGATKARFPFKSFFYQFAPLL